MIKNIIKLLNATTDDLIYEWYPTSSNLIWHSDVNKQLFYSTDNFKGSFNELLKLVHEEDKNNFLKKKNSTTEDYLELTYKIIDKQGKIQTWTDKSILIMDDKEIKYIGVCKNITKNENYLLDNQTFNNIIDNIDDFIFFKDLDFKYIGCNEAFCELVNRSKDEIIGKTDKDILDKELASFIRKFDQKVLNSNHSIKSETWINNTLMQTIKNTIKDSVGNSYAIFGIGRDQTTAHENNLKIEESKRTYMQLFQANKIPVLIIEPESGKIVDANKAALKFYGYSFEEIRELEISQINTLSKEEIKQEMALAIEEKREHFLFKHKLKSGKIKNVEVYLGPIKFKNKKLLYSIVHDISAKTDIEKELRQAHTIYQNTKEGIFITNLKGEILSVNKAFTKITGYEEEKIIGLTPKFLKSSKHTSNFYRELWNTLQRKGHWEGEIINKNKQGIDYPQWLSINTVYDYDKTPINYIAVFTDFSKIKRQEELLREKDGIMFQQSKMAAMGEMLRNIAHQWRQPLSAISSSASGIKLKSEMDMLNENDLEEFCNAILDSTNYLSDTIDDFSNFFKNKNSKENFNLKETIERSVELSSASLKNHAVTVFSSIDPIEMRGVKNELVQVLLNLINNSKDELKKRSYKREIFINTKYDNENITIIFKDNAGGIPEDIISSIFHPYFTTKGQSDGTGIGLHMSKEIIEKHFEGTIEVKNYDFNKDIQGAEFIITIPQK